MFESLNPFNWFPNLFTQNEPEQNNTNPLISLIENKLSEINTIKQKILSERFDLAQLYSLWLRKKDLNHSTKELLAYFTNHEKEFDVPEPLYSEIIQYIHDNDGDFKDHIEQLFRNNIEKNNHELEIFNFQSLIYNLILKVINQKIEATKLISILEKYLEKHPILASKKDVFLEYIAEFVDEIQKNKNNISAFENLFSKPDNFFQNNSASETQSNDDGEIYNYSSFVQTAYNFGKNAFTNLYKGVRYALKHPLETFSLSILASSNLINCQSVKYGETDIPDVLLSRSTYLRDGTLVSAGWTASASNQDFYITISNNSYLIGGAYTDCCISALTASPDDNSFYLAGMTFSASNNIDSDFFISNLFFNGSLNFHWYNIIGGAGDELSGDLIFSGNDLCFTGYSNTPKGRGNNVDISLLCLNKTDGSAPRWITYATSNPYNYRGYSIHTTPDNRVIIGGDTNAATSPGLYYDRLFLKINPNATSNTLENAVTSGVPGCDDRSFSAFTDPTGILYSTAYTNSGINPPNILTSSYSFADGSYQTQMITQPSTYASTQTSQIFPIFSLNNTLARILLASSRANSSSANQTELYMTEYSPNLSANQTTLFSLGGYFANMKLTTNGNALLTSYSAVNSNIVQLNLNVPTNCSNTATDFIYTNVTDSFPFQEITLTEAQITLTRNFSLSSGIITITPVASNITQKECPALVVPTPSPTPAPTPFPTPPVSQTPPNTQTPVTSMSNTGKSSSSQQGVNIGAIVGGVISAIVAVAAAIIGVFLYRRRKASKNPNNVELSGNNNNSKDLSPNPIANTNLDTNSNITSIAINSTTYDALPKVTQDAASNPMFEESTYDSIPKVTQRLSVELKGTAANHPETPTNMQTYAAVSAVTQQTQAIPHIYDNSPNSTTTPESTTSSGNNNVYVDWQSSQRLSQPVTSPSNVYNNVPPDFNSANSTHDADDSKKRKSQYNALNPNNRGSTSNSSFWSNPQMPVSSTDTNAAGYTTGNKM